MHTHVASFFHIHSQLKFWFSGFLLQPNLKYAHITQARKEVSTQVPSPLSWTANFGSFFDVVEPIFSGPVIGRGVFFIKNSN